MKQLLGQSAVPDPERTGEFAPWAARGSSSAGPEQAFFHVDVRRSLELHGRLARTVAMGGAVLAMLYVLVQVFVFKSWPVYQANSIVYVNPTPAKVLEPSQGGQPRWPFDSNTYESYIQQQMMDVSRDDVLVDAVHHIPGFQKPGEKDQAAAQRLVRRLVVSREPSAYQFSIGARAGDGNTAAVIANAITASYMESARRDERTGDAERLGMLREERDRIQKALDADRAEQDALNKQLGVASVNGTAPDHFDQDITAVHEELVKARTEHDEAESKFASLEAGRGPTSAAIDAEADGMIASDAGLVSMKQSLNARRAALISQMANLTPANPQYKQDELELTRINSTLEAMLKDLRTKAAARIQLELRSDLQRIAGVESQLNGQLRQLVGAAGGATPKMQRESDLAADLTRLQGRFATVDEQLHNLMLEDGAPAAAYQVTPAVAPLTRTKSGVLRNALMIVFAGLVFGVLAAIVAHRMDPRVYTGAEVERVLGYRAMAVLPDFNEVSSGVAEEYLLRLASALEHARKQGALKSCVFTGTGPGTGVTTLVNRVRVLLEAMGRPTVLVDATGVPAPAASTPSSAASGAGEHGLVPVERVSRPTALLQQMAEETGSGEKSLVLTDTAPLAVSAETEYLARFVDCAIVVIDSGTTTRAELREAARTLERLDVGAVGFVLNRVGLAKADAAFRNSVEAVERHLLAQGNSAARRREMRPEPQAAQADRVADRRSADRDRRASNVRGAGGDAKQAEPVKDVKREFPRSQFEPEVAAAAAAVARFAAHPSPDAAVCQTAPVLSAPGADAVRRFTVPLDTPIVAVPAAAVASAAEPAIAAGKSEVAKIEPVESKPAPVEAAAPAAVVVDEALAASVEPVLPEEPAAAAVAAPPVAEPAAAADLPWWLSEAPHLPPQTQRPAVLWEPARSMTVRGPEPAQPAPAAADTHAAPVAPTPAWVPAPSASRPAERGAASTIEEPEENLTSRLSGLRSLLFVLGVKESNDDNEARVQTGRERPGSGEPGYPRTASTDVPAAGGASPRLVTASPEVLPPRPIVIDVDKLDKTKGQPASRQDRRASFDGIEILPSKHGQYKKL